VQIYQECPDDGDNEDKSDGSPKPRLASFRTGQPLSRQFVAFGPSPKLAASPVQNGRRQNIVEDLIARWTFDAGWGRHVAHNARRLERLENLLNGAGVVGEID
jgi:hypothetical protein